MPRGKYFSPPRSRLFFGLIHQFITGTNPVVTSTQGIEDPVMIDAQTDFYICQQSAVFADGQDNVRFELYPGRQLSDMPLPIQLYGNPPQVQPQTLATPLVIPRGSIFKATMDERKTVPADQEVRIVHFGWKQFDHPYVRGLRYDLWEPGDYVANFSNYNGGVGTIPANGVRNFAIPIAGDSDFDVYRVAIISDQDVTVDITTSGGAMRWFNKPLHAALLGGVAYNATRQAGYVLPCPYYLPGAGVLNVEVANLTATVTRCYVIFSGVRMSPARGYEVVGSSVPDNLVMR